MPSPELPYAMGSAEKGGREAGKKGRKGGERERKKSKRTLMKKTGEIQIKSKM